MTTRIGDAAPRYIQAVSPTVLVVDDQDFVRDVIKIALEEAGYVVLETASPQAAVELARGAGDVDLLITDVVMPEMDAFELAERITHECPNVRVLYTSGYTDAGAEGPFIKKPFSPSELVEKVGALLSSPA
jgi:CheY-like chemotaxis protein